MTDMQKLKKELEAQKQTVLLLRHENKALCQHIDAIMNLVSEQKKQIDQLQKLVKDWWKS